MRRIARGRFTPHAAVAKFVWGLFKPAEAKRAIAGGSPGVYAWTANDDPAPVADWLPELARMLGWSPAHQSWRQGLAVS